MYGVTDALEEELKEIKRAANALYEAGHWSCDRPVGEAKLWEDLRDAIGREPGNAPQPIKKENK